MRKTLNGCMVLLLAGLAPRMAAAQCAVTEIVREWSTSAIARSAAPRATVPATIVSGLRLDSLSLIPARPREVLPASAKDPRLFGRPRQTCLSTRIECAMPTVGVLDTTRVPMHAPNPAIRDSAMIVMQPCVSVRR